MVDFPKVIMPKKSITLKILNFTLLLETKKAQGLTFVLFGSSYTHTCLFLML